MKIPFKQCIAEISTPVRGVIVFGQDLGSQIGTYSDNKVNHVLWLEKHKHRLPELYNMTKTYPLRQQYVTEVFSDKDIRERSKRFDTFYKENMANIPLEEYNLVVIDLDDKTELEVLDGMLSLVGKYTNIKAFHMKVRGPGDAASRLASFGFEPKLVKVDEIGWGEALYVRS